MGKSQGSSQPLGSREVRVVSCQQWPIVGNRWGLREGAHPQKEPDCTSETCGKLVGTKVSLPWAGGLSWVTRLDFARKSGGWVPPVTGDLRMSILRGLSQKESCMVYTEIRNQAENSCVCPYTDLNPVHAISKSPLGEFLCSVLDTLWESYQLYPQKKKTVKKVVV